MEIAPRHDHTPWTVKDILLKKCFLLDFVQNTPLTPIWTTCTTFFQCQNSRFEGQLRTKIPYDILNIYNLKTVHIIGILEEIDCFIDQKCTY